MWKLAKWLLYRRNNLKSLLAVALLAVTVFLVGCPKKEEPAPPTPSEQPSQAPSEAPSASPSVDASPSASPSVEPSVAPSKAPSPVPTKRPRWDEGEDD